MDSPEKIPEEPGQSNDHPEYHHVPVLLNEAIEALNIKPGGIYVDCTFGGGGHSKSILEKLDKTGKLIVFDQDESAGKNLPADDRIIFIHQNFRHLHRFMKLHQLEKADGILADLGVSSYQFDEATRGFSTRFDAPLDMRMDRRQQLTAADVLKTFPEEKLQKILEKFGEVTNAKTLAKTIVTERRLSPIRTINEFKQAIKAVVKGNPQKYFAQVFQALRIEVNDELSSLKELLQQIPDLLNTGGRIVMITFHSLEDRLVKNFFRNGTLTEAKGDDVFGTKPGNPLSVITKKPVVPSSIEIKENPRSRSAKLRAAEKK